MERETPNDIVKARERARKRRQKLAGAAYNPGEIVAGRYEVVRMLGAGGMGVVYLVRDTRSNQRLALKTLLPQYVSNKFAVRRFMREVETVRRCDHPGVVRIMDAQMDGALLYYTMEYVEGVSLRKYMRQRGRMGIGSTVRILSLVAHALEHAHQYTIHRDISPENVMVLPDGNIKLLDFGLAKLADNEGGFTMIGTSLGKLQYGAPEQRANARDVDHRADLYPLGVMFVEMLTGKLPNESPPLTDVVPELPRTAVEEFLAKTLAADPEERYPTARQVREALRNIYELSRRESRQPAGSPLETPQPEPRAKSSSWAWVARLLNPVRLLRRT